MLKNLAGALEAPHRALDQVIKTTVYVTVVPTKELHYGFKIEVEAIAAVRG